MKVLIAEDDLHTREGLIEILQNEGFQTAAAEDGQAALNLFQEETPDLVCLDVMMPKINGYDVCREIRKINNSVPILFISAKSEEIDTVVGLELGADDFIIKPFGVKSVVARIRAIIRRSLARNHQGKEALHEEFEMHDFRIIPSELRGYRSGHPVDLSLRDIKILSLLCRNKGKVIGRDQFFNECWGFEYLPNSRTLDQHVSQLRKRIEIDPKDPKIIQTVHGIGYRFE